MTELPAHHTVQRVAMTLDIKPERLEEYIAAHATPRQHIVDALRAVGLRDISLWVFRERMFYTATWVATDGRETFEDAMARYAAMPGVTEWEEKMHEFQVRIAGTEDTEGAAKDVWWQKCTEVYHQK
jgi:L-rhamnose mutarotase